jgi:hypothetical protein
MIFLTMLLLLSPSAEATTGVRNGGSAMDCPFFPLQMEEYLLAQRFPAEGHEDESPIEPILDREAFFEHAISRIENRYFAGLVRKWWNTFGDSDRWPLGTPSKFDIYYYITPEVRNKYGPDGRIPASDPTNGVCATPLYEPEKCCAQTLVSYFGKDSPKPELVFDEFLRLDRLQKNILELHEAVYRAARDLGRIRSPNSDPITRDAIARYREGKYDLGELPSMWVATLVSEMISKRDVAEVSAQFQFLWDWSFAIYGPKKP